MYQIHHSIIFVSSLLIRYEDEEKANQEPSSFESELATMDLEDEFSEEMFSGEV